MVRLKNVAQWKKYGESPQSCIKLCATLQVYTLKQCNLTEKSQMTILIDFKTVYTSIKHWFCISKVGEYPVIKQSTKHMPVDYIKDYVQYKKSWKQSSL